jgi:hypothetical protein
MARILARFPFADRGAAHQTQAAVIADGSHPGATCTETADEVLVWDSQPTNEEVDGATARGDA